MLMVEQPKLGIILEERVVEPSVPELKRQVSFDSVRADSSAAEQRKDEPLIGSFQNHLQGSENTQSHRKNMVKAKVDALVPCSDDVMDV